MLRRVARPSISFAAGGLAFWLLRRVRVKAARNWSAIVFTWEKKV
jgi:hypothetical protein